MRVVLLSERSAVALDTSLVCQALDGWERVGQIGGRDALLACGVDQGGRRSGGI